MRIADLEARLAELSQFHYGSIQITEEKLIAIILTVSQFHYGSIQIVIADCIYQLSNNVSIPLWFDSNFLIIKLTK